LYNCALEERIRAYEKGVSLNYNDQANELPLLLEELPEYNEVFSQTRQDVLRRLEKAYQAFFRRVKLIGEKAGFPRFRGRHRYDSFTYPQKGFQLRDDGRVYLSPIGKVKVKLHRPIVGKIKTCSVKREVDQWFVVFSCDIPESLIVKETDWSNDVGIDVGLTTFAVTSDEEYIANPKYFKHSQDKLAKAQRSLTTKKRGSKRRKKQRALVAKCHRKVKRQRDDFQHKTARRLVDKYDVIYMEKLVIKNMVRNKLYSKGISDVAWGQFANFVGYKAEEAGKRLIFVDPRGTTQRCSQCGTVVKKEIQDRWHCCPNCGFQADRDFNASLEIKRLGRSLRSESRATVGS
jgi:putative transposase